MGDMLNVVITGASGFVGINLCRYFAEHGATVFPISLRARGWKTSMPASGTTLIHLAGKAHDTSNNSDEEEYFKVNRDLTVELFNEFLVSGIQDFVYFSSVKATADSVERILTEGDAPNPLTPYGRSKLAAENYLLSKDLPTGKRLFIIRPCMIHGPGNKGNLNLLYKIVEKGIPWPLGAFYNQRSFLSIDNLLFILKSMLEKPDIPSGTYHLADDEALSTNEVVSLVADTLDKKPKIWSIPSGLVRAVAKLGDICPSPLNSERLKKLTESYVVSNEKIKLALGIKSLPLSAKEGMEKTLTSFRYTIQAREK